MEKLIGQSGVFLLIMFSVFLIGHTSKMHQILKIQRCKQFRVTFPSFSCSNPHILTQDTITFQVFWIIPQISCMFTIIFEYIFPFHSRQHTIYAVLLIFLPDSTVRQSLDFSAYKATLFFLSDYTISFVTFTVIYLPVPQQQQLAYFPLNITSNDLMKTLINISFLPWII